MIDYYSKLYQNTCDSDPNGSSDNLDDRLLFKIVSKHYDKNCWGYYKII